MKVDSDIERLLGRRVAALAAGIRIACPGLEDVTLGAGVIGSSIVTQTGGVASGGIRFLRVRARGWSPSLHLCDIDARIVHNGQVAGVEAAEDMVIARLHHLVARQRARADALAQLGSSGAIEWPGMHDLVDAAGDVRRAMLRPLPRRPVHMDAIMHLHVDSATVHAVHAAEQDVHLLACDQLQHMLKGATHDGGWTMSHEDDDREVRCSVEEADPHDQDARPCADPGDLDLATDEAAAMVAAALADPAAIAIPPADRHIVLDVALANGVRVRGDRVVVPGDLPDSALASLPGRPLGDLARVLPALDGRTIRDVARTRGDHGGPLAVARLEPDPWPLADADCIPR